MRMLLFVSQIPTWSFWVFFTLPLSFQRQIYDIVWKNSERLRKLEELMMRVHNTIESLSENVTTARTHGQVTTPHPGKVRSAHWIACVNTPVLEFLERSHLSLVHARGASIRTKQKIKRSRYFWGTTLCISTSGQDNPRHTCMQKSLTKEEVELLRWKEKQSLCLRLNHCCEPGFKLRLHVRSVACSGTSVVVGLSRRLSKKSNDP